MSRRELVVRCRRRHLVATCAGVVGGLGGCIAAPSFPDADVVVGPDGRNSFEPERITVSRGETVSWGFASSGHNVSCRPEDSADVQLPGGAAPFASFGSDEPPATSYVPQGETFAHRIDQAGRYVYVCVPHVNRGMIGTIEVV